MTALPVRNLGPTPDPAARVWVLHDGKPGMRSQALGLAEATALPWREIALSVQRPWRWLPPSLWLTPLAACGTASGRLMPPWPDLVIGCGRNAVRPALAIREASGGHTLAVHIQDPRYGRAGFDLLVVPEHDRLRGPRVLLTKAALHRVTPRLLDAERRRFPQLARMPRPILGVLVGGSNRAYRLGLAELAGIADQIAAALSQTGGSALVTPSRRTGEAGVRLLRQRLAGHRLADRAVVWDGSGDNPYYAYLALADLLLATPDSVSMISEAAATAKPVYILSLAGGDAKFARFHATMTELCITRPFTGEIAGWSYAPPDDNTRAARAVHALLAERDAAARAARLAV
ncbi:MAG: mitochondrial fission ELM1 family protein [Thiohalocapsa sp.]